MNINPISFGYKQKFERTKPHVSIDNTQSNPITLQNAIKEYEEKTFTSMVDQTKQAQNSAPIIQETSKRFQKESDSILYQAGKIQQKSEEIMSEIIDTSAFCNYLKRNEHMPFANSYLTQVELSDGMYDVKISEHRIIATKTNADSKDIYVFDTTDRSLTTFVKNQRNLGQARVAEAEYFFDGKDGLSQCNLDVSRGETELISKRFKYNTDRPTNTLSSVSTRVHTTLEDEKAERIFEYNRQGKLIKYLRNFKENIDSTVSAQILYEFYDDELTAFKKDLVEAQNYSFAKLYAEFTNKDCFYVQSNYDSNKTPEYDAICFYQNGKTEGSIIKL